MAASFGIGFATLCSIAICVSVLLGSTAEVEAAKADGVPIKEAGANICSRDIDCDFLIRCNPGGLKLCDHGKCVCVGGHRPHVDKVPNSAVTVKEAGANACSRDIDCDFLIKCNPGGLKLCDHGKCVCVGGHRPHVNKVPNSVLIVEEAGANACSRDIDCDFLIKCNTGGLKLCDHGKCVCVGGHHPHANKAPNSAVTVEEAGANVCSRDIDCDFVIKCNPGGLKLCDHGKCVCVGGHSPHAN